MVILSSSSKPQEASVGRMSSNASDRHDLLSDLVTDFVVPYMESNVFLPPCLEQMCTSIT